MNDKSFKWNGFNWKTSMRWGDFHEGFPNIYYDGDMVSINKDGHLVLSSSNRVEKINGKYVFGSTGLVNCSDRLGYGTYETEVKLPKGKMLWSSFWLWSFDRHVDGKKLPFRYAEIDVFEGYTNSKGSYCSFDIRRPLSWFNIESNLHRNLIDGSDEREQSGVVQGFTGFKNPSNHFIKYRVEWRYDFIKIWYDGRLVRIIDDEYTLKRFRGIKMNVILGQGFLKEATEFTTEPMVIKSFSYKATE